MSMLVVHELHEARDRLLVFQKLLKDAQKRELPAYRELLEEQVQAIEDALTQANIPDRYQVAVVGRFKVGKSSFVNRLADERLAGVNTNPETAAVSVFRYAESARAEVELISAEDWARHKEDFEASPDSHEARRYERFIKFNDRPLKKSSQGDIVEREAKDLDQLIQTWVKPGGMVHAIDAANWETQVARKDFLKQIRQFTTGREPLHYLVNKLTIYAPISILRDKIELIDTPGLDDTEKFRVALTEDLVKNVDSILFLTISGASYSAGDKEFLVRQLRRKQIKHLQVIVTKCDETFENACRDAEDEGDAPPTFDEFKAREISRVRSEVNRTLQELLESSRLDEDSSRYFSEQLDQVPIHLISSKYHDEPNNSKGGIDAVRDGLYTVLSTSSRFEHSRSVLKEALSQIATRLTRAFSERLDSLEVEFDIGHVESEIKEIRHLLSGQLKELEKETGESLRLLESKQEAVFQKLPLYLDLFESQAGEVLSELEKTDLAQHWQRRRHRRWGDLSDLQSKIADQIFPQVEVLLNSFRAQLEDFMHETGGRLEVLQEKLGEIESQHQLSGLESLSLNKVYSSRLHDLRLEFAERVEGERDAIITNLDDFISFEVLDDLEQAKTQVAEVSGTGTSVRQSKRVAEFYVTLRRLLKRALRSHIQTRIREFMFSVSSSAKAVFPVINEASHTAINKRLAAIRSALEVESEGRKDEISAYLTEMLQTFHKFAGTKNDAVKRVVVPEGLETNAGASDAGDPKTNLVEDHYEIAEDATGYTYERIFCPYIDSAKSLIIEDPYICKNHQFDNLARLCALAIRLGQVKKIELVTKDWSGSENDEYDARLETLRRDLAGRGIEFGWTRDRMLHDREVRFDNGWVVKIGRGLDIYKVPEFWTSISASDFSFRACKQTKVDIYQYK